MTTIFSKDGTLYADRKIAHYGNITSFTYGTKIFVSQDRQFVYGISGKLDRECERAKTESTIRKIVEHCILLTDEQRAFDINEQCSKYLEELDKDCIVLTKTKSLLLRSSLGKVWGGDHTPSYALGTGGWITHGRVIAGLTPEKAISDIGDYDPCTGGGVDKFSAKKLKPFVIKGEAK